MHSHTILCYVGVELGF